MPLKKARVTPLGQGSGDGKSNRKLKLLNQFLRFLAVCNGNHGFWRLLDIKKLLECLSGFFFASERQQMSAEIKKKGGVIGLVLGRPIEKFDAFFWVSPQPPKRL